MSRPLRIEYAGAWYHVMNRGRRAERIFEDDGDYSVFVGMLKEAAELWNIGTSACCLMPNHYHPLVHTPEGNLSRAMRHIATEKTRGLLPLGRIRFFLAP